MKTALLSALFVILSYFSIGQISTTINGVAHDPTITYTYASSDTAAITINAVVNNISPNNLSLTIRRVITNQQASWEDDVCWGTAAMGLCYFGVQATNPFNTPTPAEVTDTTPGILQIKIYPKDPDFGCGEYHYYIQEGATILDSINVSVCKTVSVEELAQSFSISIAPNPANSYVKVQTTGVENGTIKVLDVLGNVVLTQKITGSSKTINTDSFRNGIYFVRLEAQGVKTVNRKLIVRH